MHNFWKCLLFLPIAACAAGTAEPVNYSDEGIQGFGSGVIAQKPGGWSVSGQLFTPDTANNPVSGSVGMQQIFPDGPGPYTIQFDLVYNPQGFGVNVVPQAVATVEWSIAGNTITRKVSIANGISITGVAEAVRVTMNDASNNPALVPSQPYTVTATVVKGGRATSNVGPTLYAVHKDITPVSYIDFPIPNECGANSVLVTFGRFRVGAVQTVPLYTDGFAAQWDANNNVIYEWVPLNNANEWVPLAPGASRILVQTNRGVLTTTVILGIDG